MNEKKDRPPPIWVISHPWGLFDWVMLLLIVGIVFSYAWVLS